MGCCWTRIELPFLSRKVAETIAWVTGLPPTFMASPKTSTLARPFTSCGEILTLEIRNCAAGWSMVLLMAVEALLVRGVSQKIAISRTTATARATIGQGNLLCGGLVASGGKGLCSILTPQV